MKMINSVLIEGVLTNSPFIVKNGYSFDLSSDLCKVNVERKNTKIPKNLVEGSQVRVVGSLVDKEFIGDVDLSLIIDAEHIEVKNGN